MDRDRVVDEPAARAFGHDGLGRVVAHSCDAAAIRCAVSIAVPDGASTFWSWCSSMISAVSNHGAACSANRIISTAPIAKFGAMNAFAALWPNRFVELVEVVLGEAGGADDRVHVVRRAPAQVLARAARRR